ncbi:MAG: Spy/CpxP family protein refolding chaperone [Terracidiphilus sp.]
MYKRFLTVLASGLLVLGVALGVNAQEAAPPPGVGMGQGHRMGPVSPDEQLQRLDKSLKLTDDQKASIKPILEDRQKKMESLHSDTSLSREDRMGKMKSIMEDSNGKIREVLNDDQKKQFDEMQQRRRGRMEGHAPGGQPPAPPQQ